jgi:hypothetical protein
MDPFFDAMSDKMDLLLVWVKLLGLPLEFYSTDVFREIGNALE